MIRPDVNLLVYAYNASAPQREKAANWWRELVRSGQPIGISSGIYSGLIWTPCGGRPLHLCGGFRRLRARVGASLCWPAPTRETYLVFRALVEKYDVAGGATTDALIASFALEHKAKLASNDTDFLRFQELRVVDPLNAA